MISDRDLVALQVKGSRTQGAPISREAGEAWLRQYNRDGSWWLIPVATCRCCGEPAWSNLRCTKHQDRNPCVVEGCKRTRKAHGHLSDSTAVCGEHFKAYIRPGSPERRVLNRFFREAKKLGYARNERWPPELENRYWRFWHGLMKNIRRRSSEGAIDEAEIRKMFGWDDQ